ncbi:hypothetical protein [uncultured Agrobacterium sp.]|uniref:hypothetical protein n=1 Tax=uncultured Agrobacterium sp. TaxID=157277 RepID=UPI0025E6B028|nr:hypothetical protein [uncultured Agrobacterium sp.]
MAIFHAVKNFALFLDSVSSLAKRHRTFFACFLVALGADYACFCEPARQQRHFVPLDRHIVAGHSAFETLDHPCQSATLAEAA